MEASRVLCKSVPGLKRSLVRTQRAGMRNILYMSLSVTFTLVLIVKELSTFLADVLGRRLIGDSFDQIRDRSIQF